MISGTPRLIIYSTYQVLGQVREVQYLTCTSPGRVPSETLYCRISKLLWRFCKLLEKLS